MACFITAPSTAAALWRSQSGRGLPSEKEAIWEIDFVRI
jgi:hypothetical protein